MKKWIFILVIIIASPYLADAQCAMCKAVAETSTEAGSSVATGLNSGIVYLMAFPYILLGAVGYAIYRHRRSVK